MFSLFLPLNLRVRGRLGAYMCASIYSVFFSARYKMCYLAYTMCGNYLHIYTRSLFSLCICYVQPENSKCYKPERYAYTHIRTKMIRRKYIIPFTIFHDGKLRSCKKNVYFHIHTGEYALRHVYMLGQVQGYMLYFTGNGSLYFPAAAKKASRFHDYVINFFLLLTFIFYFLTANCSQSSAVIQGRPNLKIRRNIINVLSSNATVWLQYSIVTLFLLFATEK